MSPGTSNIRDSNRPDAGQFHTTRWTLVASAGQRSSPEASRALAELCASYWFPLYAYVRRKGLAVDDAQDVTQAFFAQLLENESLKVADPERGRFRSFLLVSLKNFLAKQWRHDAARKRGGDRRVLSLNFNDGENRYQIEPWHDATPEKLFERQWALTVLDRALAILKAEFDKAGKLNQFEQLKVFVGGDKTTIPYRELGKQLGMSEGAAKVATHRLRRRYRDLLREEIRQTLSEEDDVDDELRQLFDTLAQ